LGPFLSCLHRGARTACGGSKRTQFQPVIPVSLDADWNLISRTIVPVIAQDDIFPAAGSQFGLGDTLQSFFFSPKKPLLSCVRPRQGRCADRS
jgi:hypothetical protein